MPDANKNRPRLQNLDELFGIQENEKTDSSNISNAIKVSDQETININKLVAFHNHPFNLYEGERLEDMVSSIKANGVLVPIIVRPKDMFFEILSGHNRVNCAKLAGLSSIPAIIIEGLSDEMAMVYVVETNLIQRSFADMLHSEKAAVISLQHSKLFSQGKRNDILEALKLLENPQYKSENPTCSQIANKSKSIAKVGESYSLSKDTVARYLRINQVVHPLKKRLDAGEISFIAAVSLSYLKPRDQNALNKCLELNGFKIDIRKAELLRQYSEKSKLDEDSIFLILNGELISNQKKKRSFAFKIKPKIYSQYFSPDQKVAEVEAVIEKALEFYFQHQDSCK